jgi:hypothetical protein
MFNPHVDPQAVLTAARQLLANIQTLQTYFPGLDAAGIANLAVLLTSMSTGPVPTPTPAAPEAPPKREKGKTLTLPGGSPIDTYKLALVDAMGTGTFTPQAILALPGVLLPPRDGEDEETYLLGTLARETTTFCKEGTRYRVRTEGQAWGSRCHLRIARSKEPEKAPATLTAALERRIESRPTMARAIYQVMGPDPMKVRALFDALRERNWLPSSYAPTHVNGVLRSNPKLFRRIEIEGEPATFVKLSAHRPDPAPARTEAKKAPPKPATAPAKHTPPLLSVMAAVMEESVLNAIELKGRLGEWGFSIARYGQNPGPYLSAIMARQPTVFELVEAGEVPGESRYQVIEPPRWEAVRATLQAGRRAVQAKEAL